MRLLSFLLFLSCGCTCFSQQVADSLFHPEITDPLFASGKGPVVLIDEAHYNFHQREGRYAPFAGILERDGLNVRSNEAPFTAEALSGCRLLVIANALNEVNREQWILPTPSAFTADEIAVLKNWVAEGGSLFLIADHMPFAGAATDLAAVFGFKCYNGYAMKSDKQPDLFTAENKRLLDNPLFNGKITQVQTFTGQAFDCPPEAHPFLVLDSEFTIYLTTCAGDFKTDCTTMSAAGLAQGAYMSYGKGRLVISGEAAMFSAQLAGNGKMGMNAPLATDNVQLLRTLVKWLVS